MPKTLTTRKPADISYSEWDALSDEDKAVVTGAASTIARKNSRDEELAKEYAARKKRIADEAARKKLRDEAEAKSKREQAKRDELRAVQDERRALNASAGITDPLTGIEERNRNKTSGQDIASTISETSHNVLAAIQGQASDVIGALAPESDNKVVQLGAAILNNASDAIMRRSYANQAAASSAGASMSDAAIEQDKQFGLIAPIGDATETRAPTRDIFGGLYDIAGGALSLDSKQLSEGSDRLIKGSMSVAEALGDVTPEEAKAEAISAWESIKFARDNPEWLMREVLGEGTEESVGVAAGLLSRRFPAIKGFVGPLSTVLEATNDSGQVAQQVRNMVYAETGDKEEARKVAMAAGATSFAMNSMVGGPGAKLPGAAAAGAKLDAFDFAKGIVSGATTEGLDTVLENVALNQPLQKGVGQSAALGAILDPTLGAAIPAVEKTVGAIASATESVAKYSISTGAPVNPVLQSKLAEAASAGMNTKDIESATSAAASNVTTSSPIPSVVEDVPMEALTPSRSNRQQTDIVTKLVAAAKELDPSFKESIYVNEDGTVPALPSTMVRRLAERADQSPDDIEAEYTTAGKAENNPVDTGYDIELARDLIKYTKDSPELRGVKDLIDTAQEEATSAGSTRALTGDKLRFTGTSSGAARAIADADLRGHSIRGQKLGVPAAAAEFKAALIDADPVEILKAVAALKGAALVSKEFAGNIDAKITSIVKEVKEIKKAAEPVVVEPMAPPVARKQGPKAVEVTAPVEDYEPKDTDSEYERVKKAAQKRMASRKTSAPADTTELSKKEQVTKNYEEFKKTTEAAEPKSDIAARVELRRKRAQATNKNVIVSKKHDATSVLERVILKTTKHVQKLQADAISKALESSRSAIETATILTNVSYAFNAIIANELIVANTYLSDSKQGEARVVGGIASKDSLLAVSDDLSFVHESLHFTGADQVIGKPMLLTVPQYTALVLKAANTPDQLTPKEAIQLAANAYAHKRSVDLAAYSDATKSHHMVSEVGAVMGEFALTGHSNAIANTHTLLSAHPSISLLGADILARAHNAVIGKLPRGQTLPYDYVMDVAAAFAEASKDYIVYEKLTEKDLLESVDTTKPVNAIHMPVASSRIGISPRDVQLDVDNLAARIASASTVQSVADESFVELLREIAGVITAYTKTGALVAGDNKNTSDLNDFLREFGLPASEVEVISKVSTDKAREAREHVSELIFKIKPLLAEIRAEKINSVRKLSQYKFNAIFDSLVTPGLLNGDRVIVNKEALARIALKSAEGFSYNGLTNYELMNVKAIVPSRVSQFMLDLRQAIMKELNDSLSNKTMAYQSIDELIEHLSIPESMPFAIEDMAHLPRSDWERIHTKVASLVQSPGLTDEARVTLMFSRLYITSLMNRTPIEAIGTDDEAAGPGKNVVVDASTRTVKEIETAIATADKKKKTSMAKGLNILVRHITKQRLRSRTNISREPKYMVNVDMEVTTKHNSLGNNASINSGFIISDYMQNEDLLAISLVITDLNNPEAPPVTKTFVMNSPDQILEAQQLVRHHAENDIIVAHNAAFESAGFARYFVDSDGSPLTTTYPIVDTVVLNRTVYPGSGASLREAAETLGIGAKGKEIYDFMNMSKEEVFADEALTSRMGEYVTNDTVIGDKLLKALVGDYSDILSNSALAGVNASSKDLKRVMQHTGAAIFAVLPSHINKSGKLVSIPEDQAHVLKQRALVYLRNVLFEQNKIDLKAGATNNRLTPNELNKRAQEIYGTITAARNAVFAGNYDSVAVTSAKETLRRTKELMGERTYNTLMDLISIADTAQAAVFDDAAEDAFIGNYWTSMVPDHSTVSSESNEETNKFLMNTEVFDISNINAHEQGTFLGISFTLRRGNRYVVNSARAPLPITYQSVLGYNHFDTEDSIVEPALRTATLAARNPVSRTTRSLLKDVPGLKITQVTGDSRIIDQEALAASLQDMKKNAEETMNITGRVMMYRFVRQAIDQIRALPKEQKAALGDAGVTFATIAVEALIAANPVIISETETSALRHELMQYFRAQDEYKGPTAPFGTNTKVNAVGTPDDIPLEDQQLNYDYPLSDRLRTLVYNLSLMSMSHNTPEEFKSEEAVKLTQEQIDNPSEQVSAVKDTERGTPIQYQFAGTKRPKVKHKAVPKKLTINIGQSSIVFPLTTLDYNVIREDRQANPTNLIPFTEEEILERTAAKLATSTSSASDRLFFGLSKELSRASLNAHTTNSLLSSTLSSEQKLSKMNFAHFGPVVNASLLSDKVNDFTKQVIINDSITSEAVRNMSMYEASSLVVVNLDGKKYIVPSTTIVAIGEAMVTHDGVATAMANTQSLEAIEEARLARMEEQEGGIVSISDSDLVPADDESTPHRAMVKAYSTGFGLLFEAGIDVQPLIEGVPLTYVTDADTQGEATYRAIVDIESFTPTRNAFNAAVAKLSKIALLSSKGAVLSARGKAQLESLREQYGLIHTGDQDAVRRLATELAKTLVKKSEWSDNQVTAMTTSILKELYDIDPVSGDLSIKGSVVKGATINMLEQYKLAAKAHERFNDMADRTQVEWNTRLSDLASNWNDINGIVSGIRDDSLGQQFTSSKILDYNALVSWLRFMAANRGFATRRAKDAYGTDTYASKSILPWGEPSFNIAQILRNLTPKSLERQSYTNIMPEGTYKYLYTVRPSLSGNGTDGATSAASKSGVVADLAGEKNLVYGLISVGVPQDRVLSQVVLQDATDIIPLFTPKPLVHHDAEKRRRTLADIILGTSPLSADQQQELVALFSFAGMLDGKGNIINVKAINEYIAYGILQFNIKDQAASEKLRSIINPVDRDALFGEYKAATDSTTTMLPLPYAKGTLIGLPVMYVVPAALKDRRTKHISGAPTLRSGVYTSRIDMIMNLIEEYYPGGFDAVVAEEGLFYHPLVVLNALMPATDGELEKARIAEERAAFNNVTLRVQPDGTVSAVDSGISPRISKKLGKDFYNVVSRIAGSHLVSQSGLVSDHSYYVSNFNTLFSSTEMDSTGLSPKDRAVIEKIKSERYKQLNSDANAFFEAVTHYTSAFTEHFEGVQDGTSIGAISGAIIKVAFGDVQAMLDTLLAKNPNMMSSIRQYGNSLESSLQEFLPTDLTSAAAGNPIFENLPNIPAVPVGRVRSAWASNRLILLKGLLTKPLPQKFYDAQKKLAVSVSDIQEEFSRVRVAIDKAFDKEDKPNVSSRTDITIFHSAFMEQLMEGDFFMTEATEADRTALLQQYAFMAFSANVSMDPELMDALVDHFMVTNKAIFQAIRIKYGTKYEAIGTADLSLIAEGFLRNFMAPDITNVLATSVRASGWRTQASKYLSDGSASSEDLSTSIDAGLDWLEAGIVAHRLNFANGTVTEMEHAISKTPFGMWLAAKFPVTSTGDARSFAKSVARKIIENRDLYEEAIKKYSESKEARPELDWQGIDRFFGGKITPQSYVTAQSEVITKYVQQSVRFDAAYEAGLIIDSEEYAAMEPAEQADWEQAGSLGAYKGFYMPKSMAVHITQDKEAAGVGAKLVDFELWSDKTRAVTSAASFGVGVSAVLGIPMLLSGLMSIPYVATTHAPTVFSIKSAMKALGVVSRDITGEIADYDAMSEKERTLVRLFKMHAADLNHSSAGTDLTGVASRRSLARSIRNALNLSPADDLAEQFKAKLNNPQGIYHTMVEVLSGIEKRTKITLLAAQYRRIQSAQGFNPDAWNPESAVTAMKYVNTYMASGPDGTLLKAASISFASFMNFFLKSSAISIIGPFHAMYLDIVTEGVSVTAKLKLLTGSLLRAIMHYGAWLGVILPFLVPHILGAFGNSTDTAIDIANKALVRAGSTSIITHIDKHGQTFVMKNDMVITPGAAMIELSNVIRSAYFDFSGMNKGTVNTTSEASQTANEMTTGFALDKLAKSLQDTLTIPANYQAIAKLPDMFTSTYNAISGNNLGSSWMGLQSKATANVGLPNHVMPVVESGYDKDDVKTIEADLKKKSVEDGTKFDRNMIPSTTFPQNEALLLALQDDVAAAGAAGLFNGADGNLSDDKIVEWARTNPEFKQLQVAQLKGISALASMWTEAAPVYDAMTPFQKEVLKNASDTIGGSLISPADVRRLSIKYHPLGPDHTTEASSLFRRVLHSTGFNLYKGEIDNVKFWNKVGNEYFSLRRIPVERLSDVEGLTMQQFIMVTPPPVKKTSNSIWTSTPKKEKKKSNPGLDIILIKGAVHDNDTIIMESTSKRRLHLSNKLRPTGVFKYVSTKDFGLRESNTFAAELKNITDEMKDIGAQKLKTAYPGGVITKIHIQQYDKMGFYDTVSGEAVRFNDIKGDDTCGYNRACVSITYDITMPDGRVLKVPNSELVEKAGLGYKTLKTSNVKKGDSQ